MTIDKAIATAKQKLTNKAKRGIYENFGQKEVCTLEEQYLDISDYSQEMNRIRTIINSFAEWCMDYCG